MFIFDIVVRNKFERALCNECTFAHIRCGARGEKLIACNYGGVVREVEITVANCSGFYPRAAVRPVTIVNGFVPRGDA